MIYDGTDTLTGGGDDRVAAVMTAPGRAGVRRFRTLEQAIACVRDVEAAYAAHASAARALAEEHFDARAVASRVLDYVLG